MKKIIESYKRKLAGEEGWILKHGAQLRIALCYPNVYSIGMANLGFQAMYEIFNRIPEVSCERGFLPDNVSSARLVSLNPIRDLRVDMRQATWIINRAYPFRCIPTFAAKVRLRQEPWFIPNGFHPPVESSPVFAFGLVKTSGGFALLT